MLIDFFLTIRAAKVPCSVREYLDLVEAVQKHVAFADLDDFYALARLCLVKDEKHYDKFDKAFAAYFKGMETLPPDRKSTRLNSSHVRISYAVFRLKKKNKR